MSYSSFLDKIISNIAKNDELFCSEGDFVFHVAKEMKAAYNLCLEYPFGRQHIDLVFKDNNQLVPCEFKYKTAKATIKCEIGNIDLKNHTAYTDNAKRLIEDINKIENFLKKNKNSCVGYVIFMTNDNYYHKKTNLDWTSALRKMDFTSNYDLTWTDYYVQQSSNFKYTVIEISNQQSAGKAKS